MNAANPNGYLLSAKKLYSELPLEYALSSSLKIANYQHGDPSKMAGLPLNLILSSGPYTFDDTLDYQLLDDLLLICQNSNADVVILVESLINCSVDHLWMQIIRYINQPRLLFLMSYLKKQLFPN